MFYTYNNPEYKGYRRVLRHTLTKEEVILWSYLKNKQLGYKFRRQFGLGQYIVDFYCPEKRLVLELDGGQHNENKNELYDRKRTEYFYGLNIKVLRIWNNDINENISGTIEEIKYYLDN
ncbi:endonuclease domain-containing protein [Candidatus Kuenenbacteria bacterium]|nr:endonuclease domain-containing protein [Candidatus Kuenenbacteria bacterium]